MRWGDATPARSPGSAARLPGAKQDSRPSACAVEPDRVLVTSGAKAAYDMAFSCVRGTGTLLVVGLPANDICFPPIMMSAREMRIQASAVGTRKDLTEMLAMAAAGRVRCLTSTRPLEDANAVLDEMRQGKIAGRVVLTL